MLGSIGMIARACGADGLMLSDGAIGKIRALTNLCKIASCHPRVSHCARVLIVDPNNSNQVMG
jgi:hypothetical protein